MLISIVGLGLIGGSLGLALKKVNWCDARIISFVRRPEAGKLALKMGAIDRFEENLVKAVQDADIVIIATPVLTIKDIFAEIAPALKPGCIVTDAASTKVQVIQWAQQLLPDGVYFIGGHPMAGKEVSGIQAADATLFHNAIYCLVQSTKATPEDTALLKDMITSIGARYFSIEAEEHDQLVAGISHLPLLVSAALTSVTSQNSCWEQMSLLASSGYRDTTRLSSGNPDMSRDIVATNKVPISCWLDNFVKELQNLQAVISGDNDKIYDYFALANAARKEWLEKNYLKK